MMRVLLCSQERCPATTGTRNSGGVGEAIGLHLQEQHSDCGHTWEVERKNMTTGWGDD
jgi:hypothetical protein